MSTASSNESQEHEQVRREVAEWLATYEPQRVPKDVWFEAGLCAFVSEQIKRYDPSGVASAKKLARRLAHLGSWCLDQGMDLDVEIVLDPDTVERYCETALKDDPCAGDYRSYLRRLGRTLTTKAPWEPGPAPLKARDVAVPYTPTEEQRLVRDSRLQKTPERERTFRSFLALGRGAGLDGRWNTKVRGTDIKRLQGVCVIDVPDPAARRVVALAEWEDELLELARTAGPELLIGGTYNRNLANRRAASLDVGKDAPTLSPKRLRATWLLDHLERGTRLPELADAAGMKGITTLSDLLPHVSRLKAADARLELRGR